MNLNDANEFSRTHLFYYTYIVTNKVHQDKDSLLIRTKNSNKVYKENKDFSRFRHQLDSTQCNEPNVYNTRKLVDRRSTQTMEESLRELKKVRIFFNFFFLNVVPR